MKVCMNGVSSLSCLKKVGHMQEKIENKYCSYSCFKTVSYKLYAMIVNIKYLYYLLEINLKFVNT